jgi:hypothetical protein
VPSRLTCLAYSALLALSLGAGGQALPVKAGDPIPVVSTSPTRESEVPDVPGLSNTLHGFNAGITFAGTHDDYTGWATLVTLAIGYSFNDMFSVDVSVPIYFFRLAPTTAARPKPKSLLDIERGEVGDVVIAGHIQLDRPLFQYQFTGAVALATGPRKNGLTTGRTSFDFTNHFEREFGRITPSLDIGMGDTTTLVNRVNLKDYSNLGPLSHYQVGIGVSLPRGASFGTELYEQLPVGDQKIYGAAVGKKLPPVIGFNITEDNGLINSLDLPVGDHMSVSAFYNHSIRYRSDSVAIGYTFILRGAPPVAAESDIDTLIRQTNQL